MHRHKSISLEFSALVDNAKEQKCGVVLAFFVVLVKYVI
jgi:hypothetical protein